MSIRTDQEPDSGWEIERAVFENLKKKRRRTDEETLMGKNSPK